MKPLFLFSFGLIILLHPFISKAQSIENIQPVPANLHVDSVLHLPTHTSDMKFVIPRKITFDVDIEKDYLDGDGKTSSSYLDLDLVEKKAYKKKIRYHFLHSIEYEDLAYEMIQYYNDINLAYLLKRFAHENGYSDTTNSLLLNPQTSLYLHGKVTRVFHAHTKMDEANLDVKTKLYITWSIYNMYGEYLDSIETTRYGQTIINTKDLTITNSTSSDLNLFEYPLKQGYIALINHPRFKPYLSIDTINPNQQLPVLSIPTPTQPVSAAEDALTATVTIKRNDKGHGSGFAISNDGYVLTNYHHIVSKFPNQSDSLVILTSGGIEVPARIIRTDKLHDLALLKVDHTFKSAFLLTSTKSYEKMMEVYTTGTPSSIYLEQSVSKGILSNERKTDKVHLLQLAISISEESSGGPVFETSGKLHGVIVSKLSGFATEGISFAVPAYLIPSYLNLQVK